MNYFRCSLKMANIKIRNDSVQKLVFLSPVSCDTLFPGGQVFYFSLVVSLQYAGNIACRDNEQDISIQHYVYYYDYCCCL